MLKAKYPTLKVVDEYQYWLELAFSDDWMFHIFMELKEMKDDSLSDAQQLAKDGISWNSVGKPDVIKAALASQNVYEKEIWNKAIDAAMEVCVYINDFELIRRLKK